MERVPHTVNQYPYQTILQPKPEQTFAPVSKQVNQVRPEVCKASSKIISRVRVIIAMCTLLLLNGVEFFTGK